MDANQKFFKVVDWLKPGAVVNANGEIAVIVDVLRSAYSDNVCLYVRFPRNVGNARPYDILDISPERHLGVINWQPATAVELQERLTARRLYLEKELAAVSETAAAYVV